MQVSEIFLGLGEPAFEQLVRSISIGKLKTFQLYDRMKVRMHLSKLNNETLRKSAHRFWERIGGGEGDFATELAQAILISHLDLIRDVLDELGIPHEDGFFAKDLDPAPYLTEGWEQRVFEKFREKYPPALVLFYINHLAWELRNQEIALFAPAG